MAYNPICVPKKVLVVGGGVSGAEAARVLAIRGHKPEIFEKNSRLGGNLLPGGVPDFKEDDIALADWYTHVLKDLNVPVHLDTMITGEEILKRCADGNADAVIIATGSTPKVFSLGNDERTFTAADVLLGEKDPGKAAVIIGGGLVGCETALWLAKQGKKVTIVEAEDELLSLNGPLCHANSEMLENLIPFNDINVITSAKATGYQGSELTLDNGKSLKCDSVILAVGYSENNDLYEELKFDIPELHLLGDAKKVANIMYGIWDAFEVANHI